MAGQAFAAFGRGLDGLDRSRQFRVEQAFEGLGIAADDHQQIVEVVRDAAGQLADRLHFLRHRELFARLHQFLLGVAPLGCIADDVGEADQVSVVIADHGDRAGDENQRAVLSDAPSLDFVLVFLDGQFQRAVRFAGAALVRPIEYPEMLADDFFRGVADDLLGGAVPARHASRRVEHENGVVDDAFDQDLEMTLGAAERQIRLGDFAVQLVLHRKQMHFHVVARRGGGGQNERRHRRAHRQDEQRLTAIHSNPSSEMD